MLDTYDTHIFSLQYSFFEFIIKSISLFLLGTTMCVLKGFYDVCSVQEWVLLPWCFQKSPYSKKEFLWVFFSRCILHLRNFIGIIICHLLSSTDSHKMKRPWTTTFHTEFSRGPNIEKVFSISDAGFDTKLMQEIHICIQLKSNKPILRAEKDC